MTALKLITRALQLAGVVAGGETPNATEADDGLLTLNSLLESCSTRGLAVFTVTRVTHPIVASQASYTIGPSGADITRARPVTVETAFLLDTGASPDNETPLTVLREDQWRMLSPKDLTSTRPTCLYYNPTYPNGTLYPWPIGTDATQSLVFYLPEPLTTVTALATTISFPPGYEKWFRYQLAMEFCAEYGRPVPDIVVAMARKEEANVKRMNYKPRVLGCDPAILGQAAQMDIETGE